MVTGTGGKTDRIMTTMHRLWPIFLILDFRGSEPSILAASPTWNHPNSVGNIALFTREPVEMAGEEKKCASLNGTEVPC